LPAPATAATIASPCPCSSSARSAVHAPPWSATKLLYFAAYRAPHRPRPLIYDGLVAASASRFPGAPLFPLIADGVTTASYERYCAWAENLAEKHKTEPAVIEWSLFALGADIREELRK
jgi:hypothetical protein